eukprot:m.199532 g.199532  ORF g.199532 m.199532 type:complete len:673 (+) comp13698_c0_seq1:75-2093(+)
MGKADALWKAASSDDWEKIEAILLGKKENLLKSVRKKKKPTKKRMFDMQEVDGVLEPLTKTANVNIDQRDSTGCTPLIIATLRGALNAVKCLIAYGSNVDAQDTEGNTALHLASWHERANSSDIISALLFNNAKPNIPNNKGITPLHIAAQTGQTDVVMMLVDRGCDVKALTENNDTPLDIAVRYNREDVVSFLLNHDVSVIESTKSLREACRTGKEALVEMLLDMGMDVSSDDPATKDTALHIAIKNKRLPVVERLLQFGADPYQPNIRNVSPFNLVENMENGTEKQTILTWFEEYKEKEVQTPAIVLNERRQRKAQEAIEEYQRRLSVSASRQHAHVRVLSRWLENSKKFRSSAKHDSPVTNILSDDLSCEWEAESTGRQWVVLQLPNLFTITAISITVRPGSHVPKDVQLEVSSGKEGPWRIVKAFDMLAEPNEVIHLDQVTGTMTQKFSQFSATSQYWRLHILRTFGSSPVAIGNLRLYGFDAMIPKWFAEHGLTDYMQSFMDVGVNQLKELETMDDAKLKSLISLPGHLKKLQLAVQELKGDKEGFDRLVFTRPPPRCVFAGDVLPLFEVQSNPGANNEVELVVHGNVYVRGTTRTQLLPNGSNPSVAFFDDIILAPPGRFKVEVRSVETPDSVYVKCPHEVNVEQPPKRFTAVEALFEDYSAMLDF